MSLVACKKCSGSDCLRLAVLPQQPNLETVTALELLLDRARRGEIKGLALISLEAGNVYDLLLTGQARTRPTYTLGTITLLKQLITDRLNT